MHELSTLAPPRVRASGCHSLLATAPGLTRWVSVAPVQVTPALMGIGNPVRNKVARRAG